MPLAAEGHIFGGCEFIVMTIVPGAKKSSIVCKHLRDRFCRHRTNPEPRRQQCRLWLLCRERDNFRILVAITNAVLPAWIWTNWSAKSPKKSITIRH